MLSDTLFLCFMVSEGIYPNPYLPLGTNTTRMTTFRLSYRLKKYYCDVVVIYSDATVHGSDATVNYHDAAVRYLLYAYWLCNQLCRGYILPPTTFGHSELTLTNMAVWLAACLFVVSLMRLLANPEIAEREQQRIDFVATSAQVVNDRLSLNLPTGICIEDATAVLWSDVGTYAVGLCWVVNLEEHVAEVDVTNLERVVFNQHTLDMMSSVSPHIGVCRQFFMASSVPNERAKHTTDLTKFVLDSPETTTSKHSHRHTFRAVVKSCLRVSFDGTLHHFDSLGILGMKVGESIAAGIIVYEVIVFYLQGNGVARVDDGLNILPVWDMPVAGEQPQGIDYTWRYATVGQVVEAESRVLYHIVKEPGSTEFIGLTRQPYGQRMQYIRLALAVGLTAMSLYGNLQCNVCLIHFSDCHRLFPCSDRRGKGSNKIREGHFIL